MCSCRRGWDPSQVFYLANFTWQHDRTDEYNVLPGSLCAYLQHLYPAHPPTIVIVEPRGADCCWRSAQAGDGDMRSVMVM